MIHPGHVTIPRLESEPRLGDFLTGAGRSQAAKQMLRISNFIERYPKDGAPVNRTDRRLSGVHARIFLRSFRVQR